MTCFAGNTISYRRWIIGVRDCFFNDVISTMVTRHGCNITGTLHSSCWGFRRQKRRLNFGERQNDSRKLQTAIQNLAHAKPVNAKYLILNINHQSSFTDVNNYLPKDLVCRSRSEILIDCIGCTINRNKNPVFLFPNHKQKNFNSHSDPSSLEEIYQDNFLLKRRVP